MTAARRRRGPWGTLRSTTRAVLRQATDPIAVVPIGASGTLDPWSPPDDRDRP